MNRKLILSFLLTAAALFLFSCLSDNTSDAAAFVEFVPPEGAELRVFDVRAKGFSVEWTSPPGGGLEYAIAASSSGGIEDYAAAKRNNHIILDFTDSEILNSTYKIRKLMPGKEYEVKLFVHAENMAATEYLKSGVPVKLPYIDDAEIYSVKINDRDAEFDAADDSFTYYKLSGTETEEYSFTCNLMHGCTLYIDGKEAPEQPIPLRPNVPLEVTVVNGRTQAARDYIIAAGTKNNGLPIVIIETENNRRIRDTVRDVSAHIRIVDENSYNPLGVGLYEGEILIRGRGNSSFGMDKKGYNFEMIDKTQILDMAPSREWLLMANFTDKSLMRNFSAYELSRDMGAAFAPKVRYVDLIMNGEYLGTYCIGERVKIDEGRLDLPKLKADMTDEYQLTGSYILEINNHQRLKDDEITFTSKKVRRGHTTVWGEAEGDVVVVRQPGAANLSDAAYEYIKKYFNDAEDALFSKDFRDPETGWRAYLDSATFVDWYLINELYKQVDGDFRLSTFLYKPRGGKLHMGPVWDFDLGAGNADYRSCDDPEGWYIRTSMWFERLFEDESFAQEFKDRWNYIKSNGYFDVFFKRIDETALLIGESAKMNFEKWRILGRYVWPNAGNVEERTTYQSEVDYLKDWLSRRIEWMDGEING